MADKTFFKPRARLMLELGEQLIKNESVAILEMVKNCYDAFARNVEVRLENLDDVVNGFIVIEDDGIGMSKDTIINHWMEPATSNKKKIVDGCKEAICHNGIVRVPLGEKGIGRFGAHKLGNCIKLISKCESAEGVQMKEVYFEINWNDFDNDKYLSDVEIEVFEREPEIFPGDSCGTRIEISGLRHQWSAREYRSVYRSILALNSPFKVDDSFSVKIFSNHQDWEKGLISFEELQEMALYKANIVLENDMITEYAYEFTPWSILSKVNSRKSSEYKNTPILDLADKKKQDRINLKPFKIGKVTIELRIFDLDSYILNLGFPNEKNTLKNYLKQNGGIAIYRDNMRLYEYGEESNDWLGLGARRINNPSKTISGRLVVGAVYLDRLSSGDLVEKTSREGFIENAAYDCFVKAVLYAISCVENDRMLDKADLRLYYSGTYKNPVLDSVRSLKETIDKKIKDESLRKELNSALGNIEREYIDISNMYVKSSSIGLNMSMVVHEIDKILKELEKGVKEEGASIHIKGLVSDLSMRISSYAELIKTTKMKKTEIMTLVDSTLNVFKYRTRAHKLEINRMPSFNEGKIECAESLVRSAIMNILDNSIYWLEKYEVAQKKILFLEYVPEPGFRGLLIVDNGKGFTVPKDKLTMPFISKKEDGMGLGLHLVSEIMSTIGGKLLFPDNLDFELPEEYEQGAAVALIFKEA